MRRGGLCSATVSASIVFSLAETEGSQGDEVSWKPRIGVFVYFEVCTDTLGLQSAKIVRRASKEEVHHYMIGRRTTGSSTRRYPMAHESASGASRFLSVRP